MEDNETAKKRARREERNKSQKRREVGWRDETEEKNSQKRARHRVER